jgi:hypothetical protein
VRRLDVLGRKPLRETVGPRNLQANGGVVGLPALVGQDDELRPPVMRIGREGDQPFDGPS